MPRPFFDTLREVRGGDALDDLATELADVVAAVRKTGKAGTLTLKLSIAPASKGDVQTLMLADTISAKLPRADRGSTVFFSDDANNLSRRDPRQGEITLRAVDEPAQEIRTMETSQ